MSLCPTAVSCGFLLIRSKTHSARRKVFFFKYPPKVCHSGRIDSLFFSCLWKIFWLPRAIGKTISLSLHRKKDKLAAKNSRSTFNGFRKRRKKSFFRTRDNIFSLLSAGHNRDPIASLFLFRSSFLFLSYRTYGVNYMTQGRENGSCLEVLFFSLSFF